MNRYANSTVAATVAALALAAAPALGQSTRVLALRYGPAPDGNGAFDSFDVPTLNNAGQLSFTAFVNGVTGAPNGLPFYQGAYRADGVAAPVEIARTGRAAPGTGGTFDALLDGTFLSGGGQVAFHPTIRTTAGATPTDGIYRGDGAAAPVPVAVAGQAVPGGGTFALFGEPAINDAGRVAFRADVLPAAGPPREVGLFRDGLTGVEPIARAGQAVPGGNGTFATLGRPAINKPAQVAFAANLANTTGGTADDRGVYRGDGATLTQIARRGEAAPGGGTFAALGDVALNDPGQVAFYASVAGTPGGSSDDTGLFLGDGSATPVRIAQEGQAPVGGNGRFLTLGTPALNSSGLVAFFAGLSNTAGGSSDDAGLFLGDGTSAPVPIAREGRAAPDGNGVFSGFGNPALNEAGQIAFYATLTNTAGGAADDAGIYLYDDAIGLTQIARTGDVLGGNVVTGLSFRDGAGVLGAAQSGLNEFGDVAFRFDLALGGGGVAVLSANTVPEPASLGSLAVAATILLRRRRS